MYDMKEVVKLKITGIIQSFRLSEITNTIDDKSSHVFRKINDFVLMLNEHLHIL